MFNQRADEFMTVIGKDSVAFMKNEGIGFKFIVYGRDGKWLWDNTDLFDSFGLNMCRGRFDEVANFLRVSAYPESEKRALLSTYINDFLTDSKNVFDPEEFERITGAYVPLSKTGLSPDYGKADKILYLGDREFGRVRIQLTGTRDLDFSLANAVMELPETPFRYVWHHLDDFDPVTREATLQLIRKEFHLQTIYGKSTVKHIGGVALWERFFGCRYR